MYLISVHRLSSVVLDESWMHFFVFCLPTGFWLDLGLCDLVYRPNALIVFLFVFFVWFVSNSFIMWIGKTEEEYSKDGRIMRWYFWTSKIYYKKNICSRTARVCNIWTEWVYKSISRNGRMKESMNPSINQLNLDIHPLNKCVNHREQTHSSTHHVFFNREKGLNRRIIAV